MSSTDTASIAAAFTSSRVACFSVPDHLTSDCGPQFCSALWLELLQWWVTKHHLTTACISSTSQWDGRKSSPPAQGRLGGPHRRRRLGISPPLGSPRHAGGLQRGFHLVLSRAGVRDTPCDSWPDSRCIGAAAGGISRSRQSGPLSHRREEFIASSSSRVHPSCPG